MSSAAPSPAERACALAALRTRATGCTRCPELVRARSQVVFATGPADADLLLVGEAPGLVEDRDGVLVIGPSGQLLDDALAAIGRSRADVAIVTVVKCRTPENRSPLRSEIDHCREYLLEQIALIAPVVVCPLGSFATRVLRGDAVPLRTLRGTPEVRTLGARAVRLYPVLHPAAALYTPASVDQFRGDIAALPGLLRLGPPPQPEVVVDVEAGDEDANPIDDAGTRLPSAGAGRTGVEAPPSPQQPDEKSPANPRAADPPADEGAPADVADDAPEHHQLGLF
ncbi:hypothetical protein DSM112329_03169 [Paraconexibacter sp. AEG42_29]|uniref:Type-4 uracil-DNA glycosylase n=1 Tax=Paraconexibacter sp. AEG42_29 TaxID=2997339 RepID=A0AAU7AXD1_9ACTN